MLYFILLLYVCILSIRLWHIRMTDLNAYYLLVISHYLFTSGIPITNLLPIHMQCMYDKYEFFDLSYIILCKHKRIDQTRRESKNVFLADHCTFKRFKLYTSSNVCGFGFKT